MKMRSHDGVAVISFALGLISSGTAAHRVSTQNARENNTLLRMYPRSYFFPHKIDHQLIVFIISIYHKRLIVSVNNYL